MSIAKGTRIDLHGQRFGRLLVANIASPSRLGTIWRCVCDCGNERLRTTAELRTGKFRSCGCSHNYKGSESCRWNGYQEISGRFWSNIKNNAIRRDICFNITIEDAWDIFLRQDRKCALSGVEITFGLGKLKTASLDRIDSSLGYSKDNIQWLHKDINLMKLDMTQEEFLKWVHLIHGNSSTIYSQ